MSNNFNILEFAGLSKDRPWELSQPLPTDLRAVITTEQYPTLEDVGKKIATYVGESIEAQEIQSIDKDCIWTMRVRLDGMPTDFVLWIEPLADTLKEEVEIDAGWVLALQTVLDTSDPLTHFSNLMRLLAGADLCVHSIYDVPTGRWFPRQVLEKVFLQSAFESPEEVLWITRLVEAPSDGDPEDRWAWITTHGLTRCGRMELEMLGVPAVLSTEAIQLIDGLAALTLESPLPSAGQVISLGPQIIASVMPCEQAIQLLDEAMPGDEARTVPSVAIVSSDGSSVYPLDALNNLRTGEIAVAKTLRYTQRKASIARDQWDLLVRAAQHIGSSEHATCMVQVPWSNVDDEDAPREYLWFRIVEVKDRTVVGELAHKPQYATGLPERHREDMHPDDITDWLLMTPVGPMGPDDAEAIDEFLTQFTS